MTGSIFLAVMITAILLSSLSAFLIFALIVIIGSMEYSKLASIQSSRAYAALNLGLFILYSSYGPNASLYLFIGSIIYTIGLFLMRSTTNRAKEFGYRLLGPVLVVLPFIFLLNPEIAGIDRKGILFFFLLLWTSDSMAYVSGRMLGRNKLWPRISPKKTWEGLLGGLLSAMVLAYFIHPIFDISLNDSLVMAFLIGVFGTLGDLLESSLKRIAGVKDSGSFMPGHGGVLDRFDGLILSTPMVYIYLALF